VHNCALKAPLRAGRRAPAPRSKTISDFPTGISGQRLASRAQLQALKFGVRFAISRETITAEQVDGIHKLTLGGWNSRPLKVCCCGVRRAVSQAFGGELRRGLRTVESITQRPRWSRLFCREKEVIVVGGGNSAGQAALYFYRASRKHVHHIVRGKSLAEHMSQYLISRIESSSHITLYTQSEIVKFEGESSLERVTWISRETGESIVKPIGRSVFVMIGAEPNSGWLFGTVRLDKKGFILTGGADGFDSTPYATSVPGMFAVGDVRSSP
jgi:thioredoxin reductase (NADPH)